MVRSPTIANNPRRVEIDDAIADGWSNRRIAAAFGVGRMAVQRRRHALATGCKAAPVPPTAPADTLLAVASPTPAGVFPVAGDPFDLTTARYPWQDGETPQPDPLAAYLRQAQRQSGTAAVREAALALVTQYAGMTDEILARKLDAEPARIAAWRAEAEAHQLARLENPRSLLAKELAAVEARERAANQKLANTEIGSKTWTACHAVLHQAHRQKMALLERAGVSLAIPAIAPKDRATTLADMLKAGAADVMIAAGASPDATLDQGLDQFTENLEAAWEILDQAAEPEDGKTDRPAP